jgi:hypothetical protein
MLQVVAAFGPANFEEEGLVETGNSPGKVDSKVAVNHAGLVIEEITTGGSGKPRPEGGCFGDNLFAPLRALC